MKTLKNIFFSVGFIYCLCVYTLTVNAQGSIIVSGQPEIFASKNPKIYSGDTEAQMLTLNINEVKQLYNHIDKNIADNWIGYGVKGNIQTNGYINIALYAYDITKSNGRGNLLYGVALTTDAASSFKGTYWQVPKEEYLKANFINSEQSQPSNKAFKPIISGVSKYFRNTSGGAERKLKNASIPILVEATMFNATLKEFKLPGIDIITDPTFNLPHKQDNTNNFDQVYANYTNYKAENIAANLNISKYTSILDNINPKLSGMKVLRMGNGANTSIDKGFMRIEIPRSGVLHFAAFSEDDLKFFPHNSQLNIKTLSQTPVAFRVSIQEPDKPTETRNFSLYTVHGLQPGSTLFLQARQTGPYLLASKISLSKKPMGNSGNRNFLEPTQSYYNNAFIVCAHRGYWLEKGIPENHPAAFEAAFNLDDQYMTMIEMDVAYTKDNIPVLMHDPSVDRLTTFWDNAPASLKSTNIKNIYYYQVSIDKDPTYPYASYGPLENAKLKDRFGDVVTQVPAGTVNKVYTLEDAMDYFKDKLADGKRFTIALDKVTARINEAFGIVLKANMEQYTIFKGPAKTYQVSNLEVALGPVMEQIFYTPYFFSEVETPGSSFDAIYQAFIDKDALTSNRWYIPAMEMQMKTDYNNAPSFRQAGHVKMAAKINDLRSRRKWVGITPVVPSRCDGVDIKTLFDNCTEADLLNPLKASSCSNYDWRADLNFDLYEVKSNYWITDRPLYTINFLKDKP